ncbi:motility associated factor glycosyltransferase family protein [Pseudoalteromonas sp. SYSU M81236]|jgi:hypothetical protein|uniref:motility associated factor glycosyltransferase family protein n=1 Tax=Pseudoalteromonas sp. SYSU M81236 TaxID=3447014 RepID=UPI003F1231EA
MTLPDDLKAQFTELEQKLNQAQEQQIREQKFAVDANERFQNNFIAFEKFYPNIARAIENYQPREDFCIHVTKTGFGNFICKGESTPIYSDSPLEQAKVQVTKSIESPTFTLTSYSHYPKDMRDTRLHIEFMRKLGKEIGSIEEDGSFEALQGLPSRFPTAMIFGIGLGYHLPILLSKTDFDYVFVIEPDFEVFFASLYCTDWYEIINKLDNDGSCLFLLLGATSETIVNDLKTISEDIGAFSIVRSFCYQHTPMPELNSVITKFFEDYFQFQFGHGFYNDAITGLSHSFYHLKNGTSLYSPKNRLALALSDTPVLIVGNGPSLDEVKDFLIKNQDNAIIFACGTALTSLLRMGVKVDFHILVERPYRNYQAVLDMASKSELNNINLMSVNTVYPDTTGLYNWSGLALKGNEAGTDFINSQLMLNGYQKIIPTSYSNPLVANTGLSFAIHFGFKNIYLMGVDNGKSNNGKSHSIFSIYNDNSGQKYRYNASKKNDGYLKGNLGGKVLTNHLYKVSNNQLERLIELSSSNIYNVGSGAYIEGAIPVKVEDLIDLDSIDKKVTIEAIKNLFTAVDFKGVNSDSLNKNEIDEVFEHLISIASEIPKSIEDASNILKRQQRYLYTYKKTLKSHIFHIIKGSLLYYHCPMVTYLFKFDESSSLIIYSRLNGLWVSYLKDMKSHCERHLLDKCDWELY